MSSFVAWWNLNGDAAVETTVRRMLDSGGNPECGEPEIWLQQDAALASQPFWPPPEEQDHPQVVRDAESGCGITGLARLDNRADLLNNLGIHTGDAGRFGDVDLILRAFCRWGEDCVHRLLGDFAFVVWDPAGRRMFAARDALGCQELYYFHDHRCVLLATRLSAILKHPAVQPALNEKRIAKHLAIDWSDNHDTFYENIYHLPPAHCLVVTPQDFRLRRYWDVQPEDVYQKTQPQGLAEQYKALLQQAVKCRMRSAYPMGISLSGGLDSSSLTVLAAEAMPRTVLMQESLRCYSYVFDELRECDERSFILPVIERASQVYPVQPVMVAGDALWPAPFNDDWLIQRDYPLQDPYYYLLRALLQAGRRDGLRLMMSGFYGDDLYAGEHYWLADMLVEGRFRQAAALLRQRVGQVVPRRDLWDYGVRAVVPQSIKQVYRSVRPAVPRWARLIHPELAARSGLLENRQDPASFRAPGRQKRFRSLFYSAYPESITVMQEIAWQSGMQYVFPFMDRRIVEFVLQVPTELVGLPGDSRRILRDAMGDGLPDVVRQRQDKTGLFELFDKGIFEVGFADIRKLFNQPQVVKRGYVQEEWLRNEFSKRPGEQDGLRLWITLSLETWLQKYW